MSRLRQPISNSVTRGATPRPCGVESFPSAVILSPTLGSAQLGTLGVAPARNPLVQRSSVCVCCATQGLTALTQNPLALRDHSELCCARATHGALSMLLTELQSAINRSSFLAAEVTIIAVANEEM